MFVSEIQTEAPKEFKTDLQRKVYEVLNELKIPFERVDTDEVITMDVHYILTVNGVDYDVVPINSHKSGIKVIRYTNYSITDDYVQHVSEPIKSAKLTVKINTPDLSYSPYVSDIKICIGKAAVNNQ